MNATSARDYILAQPAKLEPIPTPFWPNLDGSVYLQDVPGDDLTALQLSLKDDPAKMMGAMLCKALVEKDKDAPDSPAQPIFQPTDRDAVAHLGSTILLPVMQKIQEFFGLDASAVEALKKS